jgi:choice-of-anchor A domain-containing protein/pilin isopeptide linkage protein
VTFNDGTKTVYTYEDNDVTVTATLQHANAIPDNAELKVTPVTKTTAGYNYDAYMQALNNNADKIETASVKDDSDYTSSSIDQKYNSDNTLLYDIAFIADKKEYEPTEGMVSFSMKFKKKQLTEDLLATDDITVVHLPLTDTIKDSFNSTKDATNISADDVQVDTLSDITTLENNEQVDFSTNSLSMIAFTVADHNPPLDIDWLYFNDGKYYQFTNTYTTADLEGIGETAAKIQLEYHYIDNDSETFAQSKFYNKNLALGIAGNFHIVAFGTATLGAHTNGNILCNKLVAGANFGTNGYDEISAYIANSYTQVNGSSGSKTSNPLCLGSSIGITFQDNGSSFAIGTASSSTRLDKPHIVYRDGTKKFIDIDQVESDITSTSTSLSSMNSTLGNNINYDNGTYTLNDPDGVAVLNLTKKQVEDLPTDVNFKGFESGHNGSIIVNVDCENHDVTLPERALVYIDGKEQSTTETTDFSAGKVIWNFKNCNSKTITAKNMSGTIIALGASVELTQNINGTIIAENTHNNAETHRSDFTGKISGDSTNFNVKKSFSSGTWPSGSVYTINISRADDDNAPLPTTTSLTLSSDDSTKNFGDITYSPDSAKASGTYSYYYKIFENSGNNPVTGVTYDPSIYYIKVVVEYDNTINHTAEITGTYYNKQSSEVSDFKTLTYTSFNSSFSFEFSNSYSIDTKASLTVTKNLVGRSWKETDSFEYALSAGTNTAGVETPMPDATTGSATSANQAVTFGPISYAKAGTYNYTIKEVVPEKPIAGVAYDTTEHAVVVTVTNDGSGKLTAAVTYDGATSLTSTNTYSASGTASLTVTKALVGRSWKETDSFEYDLSAGTNTAGVKTPMPEKTTGIAKSTSQAVTFGPISYAKAGTYNYTIKEVVPEKPIAGVAYDTTEHAVVVTVTDDGSGKLTAAVTYDGATSLTSTNTYSASGTASLTVTKALVGRSWKETDSFEYALSAGTNTTGVETPMPDATTGSATSANQAVTFGPISYAKAGTYNYTIKEVVPEKPIAGVAYDTTEHAVVVTVTDDGSGKLTAAVTYDGVTSLTSTNTYSASGTASLTVTKALAGRAWNDTDSFEYKLTAEAGTPMPSVTTGQATKDHQAVTFGPISYTKAGTYNYTIKEVVPEKPIAGVAYDTREHAVVVTITDDGSGKLTAAVTYDGATSLTSTNTYSASGTASLTVTKALVGRSWKETDSFEYDLSAGTNTAGVKTPMPEKTTGIAKSTSQAVTFGPISYAKAGTYNYTIKEVVPEKPIAGVAYDTAEHAVVVTVTDDGSGNLTAAVTYDGATSLTSTNTYSASGTASLTVTKNLVGRSWKETDSFEYALSAGTNTAGVETPMPDATTGSATSASPAVTFGPISYAKAGVYNYTIKEVVPAEKIAGVAYDTAEHAVVVTVTDDGSGKLTAAVTYDDGSATLTSTNTYSASGTASLTVTKNLVGRSWKDTDSFEYKLTAGTNNNPGMTTPVPTSLTGTATSTSKAVTFGPISYTKAGVYNYTIQEVVPAEKIAGVTYDMAEHAVVVTVTDDGSGKLTAVVAYDGAATLTSTNTYSASGTASLTVTKNLVGRSWKETDSFEYALSAGTNTAGVETPMPDTTTGSATSASQAVTFGPISYAKAGVYNYTIKEVVPAEKIAGVSYDTAEHAVVVTVTDGGSGKLTAAVTYDGATSLTSTNTYSASGTASLTVTKALAGRAWNNTDSFEYKLTAGTNSNPGMTTPVPTSLTGTATSTSHKTVTFGPISYTKAGTYSYTIQEVVPSNPIAGVAYDTLEHAVVVTVTDDGSGKLTAAVTYDGAATLTSTNTYSASGTASLTVTKNLVGRSWKETDSFEYALSAGTNTAGVETPMPDTTTGSATSASQAVTFGPISYTKAGSHTTIRSRRSFLRKRSREWPMTRWSTLWWSQLRMTEAET